MKKRKNLSEVKKDCQKIKKDQLAKIKGGNGGEDVPPVIPPVKRDIGSEDTIDG